jgi:hypothetical protein
MAGETDAELADVLGQMAHLHFLILLEFAELYSTIDTSGLLMEFA